MRPLAIRAPTCSQRGGSRHLRLARVVNRYVGNLAPMPGMFPDYPAPVVRNTDTGHELS